ncbi:MAG: lytic transglycosylase domain-containing protein [Nitrospirae bacterium]|nr:lytic transglycosylase domain-containing protein [Candidatus Troglogloeales bacterium]
MSWPIKSVPPQHTKSHESVNLAGRYRLPPAHRKRFQSDGRVTQWIDERHDPVKSTKAAMQYLQDLYEIFGSWPLSMASYNAGEGRIGRTLATTGATDYWELKAMGRMPRETRDYVPKFIAATMIAKNPFS